MFNLGDRVEALEAMLLPGGRTIEGGTTLRIEEMKASDGTLLVELEGARPRFWFQVNARYVRKVEG